MDNFNISSWLKDQYLNEAGLGSSKAQSLAKAIDDAMMEIDDSMSYRDFAIAVGIILKEEYGSHNFEPFMNVLHAELGMQESLNEETTDLGQEFSSEFGFRAHSSMWGNEGKIEILVKDDIAEDSFEKMIQWVESKGYKVNRDQSNEWFDTDDDRYWYPRIIFSK